MQRRSLIALGAVLTFVGAIYLHQRTRFVTHSIAANGAVTYVTRRTVGVALDGGPQIPVKKPWLHLYRIGERVRVRWQPDRTYPGQLLTRARMDTFSGLWLAPAGVIATGVLFMIGGAMRSVTLNVDTE